MELFKYNDVIGAVVGKKTTNGITMLKIDYAGTIMYLPESDNELKNNEIILTIRQRNGTLMTKHFTL